MPGQRVRRGDGVARLQPHPGPGASAGHGPLKRSRDILPRYEGQCVFRRPYLARGRRTLCPSGGSASAVTRSSPEVCSAALHTHLPRARRSARLFLPCTPFVPHYGTPVTDSPKGNYYVRSRYSVLRSCRLVSASGFPASHRSLKSPLPVRLQSLRLHLQHQLVRAAGLLRFTVPGIVP